MLRQCDLGGTFVKTVDADFVAPGPRLPVILMYGLLVGADLLKSHLEGVL